MLKKLSSASATTLSLFLSIIVASFIIAPASYSQTGSITIGDFSVGAQASDHGCSTQYGLTKFTPSLNSGGGETGLVSDTNNFDPDCFELIVKALDQNGAAFSGAPATTGTPVNVQITSDFRLCGQMRDVWVSWNRTEQTAGEILPFPGLGMIRNGEKRCTGWASEFTSGALVSAPIIDGDNGANPDWFNLFLEKRPLPPNITRITNFQIGLQLSDNAGSGGHGVIAYTQPISGAPMNGYHVKTGMRSDSDSQDPDAIRLYISNVTTGAPANLCMADIGNQPTLAATHSPRAGLGDSGAPSGQMFGPANSVITSLKLKNGFDDRVVDTIRFTISQNLLVPNGALVRVPYAGNKQIVNCPADHVVVGLDLYRGGGDNHETALLCKPVIAGTVNRAVTNEYSINGCGQSYCDPYHNFPQSGIVMVGGRFNTDNHKYLGSVVMSPIISSQVASVPCPTCAPRQEAVQPVQPAVLQSDQAVIGIDGTGTGNKDCATGRVVTDFLVRNKGGDRKEYNATCARTTGLLAMTDSPRDQTATVNGNYAYCRTGEVMTGAYYMDDRGAGPHANDEGIRWIRCSKLATGVSVDETAAVWFATAGCGAQDCRSYNSTYGSLATARAGNGMPFVPIGAKLEFGSDVYLAGLWAAPVRQLPITFRTIDPTDASCFACVAGGGTVTTTGGINATLTQGVVSCPENRLLASLTDGPHPDGGRYVASGSCLTTSNIFRASGPTAATIVTPTFDSLGRFGGVMRCEGSDIVSSLTTGGGNFATRVECRSVRGAITNIRTLPLTSGTNQAVSFTFENPSKPRVLVGVSYVAGKPSTYLVADLSPAPDCCSTKQTQIIGSTSEQALDYQLTSNPGGHPASGGAIILDASGVPTSASGNGRQAMSGTRWIELPPLANGQLPNAGTRAKFSKAFSIPSGMQIGKADLSFMATGGTLVEINGTPIFNDSIRITDAPRTTNVPIPNMVIGGQNTLSFTVNQAPIAAEQSRIGVNFKLTLELIAADRTADELSACIERTPPPQDGDLMVARFGGPFDFVTGPQPVFGSPAEGTAAWIDNANAPADQRQSTNPAMFFKIGPSTHTVFATDLPNRTEVVSLARCPRGSTACTPWGPAFTLPASACNGTYCQYPEPVEIRANEVTRVAFAYVPQGGGLPPPWQSPRPQCDDDIDNDNDRRIDFGLDPGCDNLIDDDERDSLLPPPPPPPASTCSLTATPATIVLNIGSSRLDYNCIAGPVTISAVDNPNFAPVTRPDAAGFINVAPDRTTRFRVTSADGVVAEVTVTVGGSLGGETGGDM